MNLITIHVDFYQAIVSAAGANGIPDPTGAGFIGGDGRRDGGNSSSQASS